MYRAEDPRSSPRSLLVVGWILAFLACVVASPQVQAGDEPKRRAELHFRDALASWVEGDARAPGRYAGVQAAVIQSRYSEEITLWNWFQLVPKNEVGEHRPRGLTCLRDSEAHTTELVRRQSTEALVALVAFHVEVMRHHAAPPARPWLYLARPRALENPLDELEDSLDDRQLLADLRVTIAGHAYTNGTYELSQLALEDLEEALDHDKNHVGALYWKAIIHEKLGETRRVRSSLGDLLELRPDAADARLRFAINQLRRGDVEEGEARLEELASDLEKAPAHADLRALAFQEWARSVAHRGDEAAARQIAHRGVRAVPGNERLQMQLAFYERVSNPQLSLDLARRLTSDLRGRAVHRLTARGEYELPAPELAKPPFERIGRRVATAREELREALAALDEEDLARGNWVKCRGW